MLKRFASVAIVMALVLGLAGTAMAGVVASLNGSLFDPNAGTVLGDLNVTSDFSFDTDALTGSAFGGTGDVARSQDYTTPLDPSNPGVELAMYAFDSVSIGSGGEVVNVTVTGNRGLALASMGDLTIGENVTFNLAGTPGQDRNANGNASGGLGGPGACGGQYGTAAVTDASKAAGHCAPPGNLRGQGGRSTSGVNAYLNWGYGPGGGRLNTANDEEGGGGGAYGGNGGDGGDNSGSGGDGGALYGDDEITNLYGGSGGGGSREGNGARAPGGGGGGSIELIALGTLTFSGTINAYGGRGGNATLNGNSASGGGGSGGGVILAATTLDVTAGAAINAYGGLGGNASGTDFDGGGGGGGRIAWYYDTLLLGDASNVNVSGGVGPGDSLDGADGTFWLSGDNGVEVPFEAALPVPEPAGLGLAGLVLAALRRKRK
jgi:MYXO-CTERM domain-containing protein